MSAPRKNAHERAAAVSAAITLSTASTEGRTADLKSQIATARAQHEAFVAKTEREAAEETNALEAEIVSALHDELTPIVRSLCHDPTREIARSFAPLWKRAADAYLDTIGRPLSMRRLSYVFVEVMHGANAPAFAHRGNDIWSANHHPSIPDAELAIERALDASVPAPVLLDALTKLELAIGGKKILHAAPPYAAERWRFMLSTASPARLSAYDEAARGELPQDAAARKYAPPPPPVDDEIEVSPGVRWHRGGEKGTFKVGGGEVIDSQEAFDDAQAFNAAQAAKGADWHRDLPEGR